MPYFLRADGVDDHVVLPSTLAGNVGTDAYTFEFKAAFPVAGNKYLLAVASGTQANGLYIESSGRLNLYAGGGVRYQSATGFILFDSTLRTYRLEHDAGGDWRMYRDGVQLSAGTYTASVLFSPLGIFFRQGSTGTNYLKCDIAYFECTGLTNAQRWDSDLSGGSGSTWPTVSGTNQGTLVNFSVPSCWIFYSSGASNTVAVSATLPKITGSLTLNEINPSYVISVNGQLPRLTGAVALNETNPVFTVAVAGQLPKLTGSIALNQFANNRQAVVNGVLPKLTGAVTLNRTQPNNQAAVSGQLPRITASITLRVPDSYHAANPNDYTVKAYLSTDSTYTARLSESSTINAIISASSTFSARLN